MNRTNKVNRKNQCLKILLIAGALLIFPGIFAQDPPPPPAQGHGSTNNGVPGGGAPVGEGVVTLAVFAGFYLLKKLINEIFFKIITK